MAIKTDGIWFKDEHGRTRLLRGVNLSATSKFPAEPNCATHISENFFNLTTCSFVGRPFSLDQADEHFTRLKSWGLNFLRFLVTWEAIAPFAPEEYDEEYLDYLQAIIEKAYEYDMMLFIDPHQDVWSRYSGGDGAPKWTFDAIGMDVTRFKDTGAAIVHQTHGDPLPKMIWPTNYTKLASATMFTLFFGGNDFTPETTVDGVPIQDYLQSHYFKAIQQVAKRLVGLPNVIGYETMNEPSHGFISWRDIRNTNRNLVNLHETPSPFQAMLLGCGIKQEVEFYHNPLPIWNTVKTIVIDPQGEGVWKEGYDCIWKQNGVWDFDKNGEPRVLRPSHFIYVNNHEIDYRDEYLRPFFNKYAEAIREVDEDAIIFLETDYASPPAHWCESDAQNVVFAPHWYDGLTLFTKRYTPYVVLDTSMNRPIVGTKEMIRDSFVDQLGNYKEAVAEYMGEYPTLIGEIGIPYDMHDKLAYDTGDFSKQIEAMDANMNALDANLLSFTLWNYSYDNTNARGDLWNGEDLSIFSYDQQTNPDDINSGGRALKAVLRPYAMATAGEPLRMNFDIHTGVFTYAFRHDESITEPTEFYVPNTQYPEGYKVEVSDGRYDIDTDNQVVRYWHSDKDVPHLIRILPTVPRELPSSDVNKVVTVGVLAVVMLLLIRWWRRRKKKPDTLPEVELIEGQSDERTVTTE